MTVEGVILPQVWNSDCGVEHRREDYPQRFIEWLEAPDEDFDLI